MRTVECLTCDQPFTPRPEHPGYEASHCPACWRVLWPLWRELVVTRPVPAMRSEFV